MTPLNSRRTNGFIFGKFTWYQSCPSYGRGSSKMWKLARQHKASFTGGKTRIFHTHDVLLGLCDGSLNFIDLSTGEVLHSLGDEDDDITCYALSNSNTSIITSCQSGLFKLYQVNITTSTNVDDARKAVAKKIAVSQTAKFRGHTAVSDLVFSADDSLVASSSSTRAVRVYKVPEGYCTHNFQRLHSVPTRLNFHPESSRYELFVCFNDGQIGSWRLITKVFRAMKSHMNAVTNVAFVDDRMVSSSRDKVITLWDLDRYEPIQSSVVYEELNDVSPFTDSTSRQVFVGGQEGRLRLFDLTTKKFVSEEAFSMPSKCTDVGVIQVFYDSSRKQLYAVTNDDNIFIYEVESTGARTKSVIVGNADEILDVSCSQRSQRAFVATNSPQFSLFNLETFQASIVFGHSAIVSSVCFSHDERFVVSGSKDMTVRLWKLCDENRLTRESGCNDSTMPTISCLRVSSKHAEAVSSVAWASKSNKFVVSGCKNGVVSLFNTRDVCHDGSTADIDSAFEASLHAVAHTKDINSIAVSPDDTLIATGSQDRTIKILTRKNLNISGTLSGHKRSIWKVAFSRSERLIASASADKSVRLWSLDDFSCVRTFGDHSSSVLGLTFCGESIVSHCADGTLHELNLQTNERTVIADGHSSSKVWALDYCAAGPYLVSGGSDASLNVWRDLSEELENAAKKVADENAKHEQTLSNLMQRRDYSPALQLALSMQKPRMAFKILSELQQKLSTGSTEISMAKLWRSLDHDSLRSLLTYTREWNSSKNKAKIAHFALGSIFENFDLSSLASLPEMSSQSLDGLRAYSERNLSRLDRLLQRSHLIDYVTSGMGNELK